MKNHTMMSIVGKDRPGIIAQVTRQLYQLQCNLEDVSMTILEGEFAMILVLSYAKKISPEVYFHSFRKALSQRYGLTCALSPLRSSALKRGEKHDKNSVSYILSAFGKDKTGIVFRISSLLARKKFNITDMNCRILGYGKKATYALVLEFDAPRKLSPAVLTAEMGRLSRQLNIPIDLKPVERLAF